MEYFQPVSEPEKLRLLRENWELAKIDLAKSESALYSCLRNYFSDIGAVDRFATGREADFWLKRFQAPSAMEDEKILRAHAEWLRCESTERIAATDFLCGLEEFRSANDKPYLTAVHRYLDAKTQHHRLSAKISHAESESHNLSIIAICRFEDHEYLVDLAKRELEFMPDSDLSDIRRRASERSKIRSAEVSILAPALLLSEAKFEQTRVELEKWFLEDFPLPKLDFLFESQKAENNIKLDEYVNGLFKSSGGLLILIWIVFLVFLFPSKTFRPLFVENLIIGIFGIQYYLKRVMRDMKSAKFRKQQEK